MPIACTLTATQMADRRAEMAAIGRAALLGARAVVRFRADAETRRRLEAIVAAEAECCAFLDLALRDQDDALALTIGAPPEARPVRDELVAAFGA